MSLLSLSRFSFFFSKSPTKNLWMTVLVKRLSSLSFFFLCLSLIIFVSTREERKRDKILRYNSLLFVCLCYIHLLPAFSSSSSPVLNWYTYQYNIHFLLFFRLFFSFCSCILVLIVQYDRQIYIYILCTVRLLTFKWETNYYVEQVRRRRERKKNI